MDNNEVLAKVGEKEITQEDVNILMQRMDPQASAQFNSPEGKKRVVYELVNQELIYLDAIDKKVDQEDEFKAQFEKTKADFTKQYYMNKLLNDISIDDKEVLEFYGLNRDMFVEGGGVKASHILVETEDQASDILKEINGGLSFEEAAQKYSSCPSKEVGGDLGTFTKGKMVPEFENAAFNMKIGEISEPVKTQFGYHLIKVFEKTEPKIMSFDEVKSSIKNHMLSEKQQDVYFKKIGEIKEKYDVKINV